MIKEKDIGRTPWIGVDLDGTLAEYNGWKGPFDIGAPIPLMVARIVKWVTDGLQVRILTARVSLEGEDIELRRAAIQAWLGRHVYPKLPEGTLPFKLTCIKDWDMIELWDDRCVQVIPNTGKRADGKED